MKSCHAQVFRYQGQQAHGVLSKTLQGLQALGFQNRSPAAQTDRVSHAGSIHLNQTAFHIVVQGSRSMHCMRQSTVTCRGFVGENTQPAGAYYCNDFCWEELRDDPGTVEALQRQAAAAAQAQAGTAPPLHSGTQEGHTAPPISAAVALEEQDAAWEALHLRDNATARFYKERRYLLLEFPQLTQQGLHILEIGCGCGSSLLPPLKANPTCRATATDISPTAVGLFQTAARQAGIEAHRLNAFVHDAAQIEGPRLAGLDADVCMIIFTLAALDPAHMHNMLSSAWQALRPGGLLLIRDHGILDLTHLRLPGEQQLGSHFFRRLDGTTCYFFSVEDLTARASAAGFVSQECSYACTSLRNRKKNLDMKRVFVHGVFGKP